MTGLFFFNIVGLLLEVLLYSCLVYTMCELNKFLKVILLSTKELAEVAERVEVAKNVK